MKAITGEFTNRRFHGRFAYVQQIKFLLSCMHSATTGNAHILAVRILEKLDTKTDV